MLCKVARSVTNNDLLASTVRLLLIARWALSRALTLTGIRVLNERALALVVAALTLADFVVEEVLVAALMVGAAVLVVVKIGALADGPV